MNVSGTRQFSRLSKSISLRLILVVPFILQILIAVGSVGWRSIQNCNQAIDDDTKTMLCLSAFGVATGLGIFTSYWVTKPILQLSRASKAITEGDLSQTTCVQGVAEINVLGRAFNQMTQQLQESVAQLARTNEELELRVAQRTTALQASEAKFAAAFRSSPNPLAIATLAEGRFIEVNESFCQIFGYDAKEVIGHTSLELNLFQDREQRAEITESLQAKRAFYNQEMEFPVRSGAIRTMLVSAELITLDGTPCILWVSHDITERKQIEAALQRSEAKYRNIFENSQVGIFRSRLEDGLCLDANQRLSDLLGYDSPADLIGIVRTTDFYVNLGDRTKILEAYRENREFHDFEIPIRKRDGSVFWGLVSARPTEAGYVEGVIGNISDRKRAEEALRVSEAKFAAAFRASPHPVVLSTLAEGRYVNVNESFCRVMGYTSEEVIGRTSTELNMFNHTEARSAFIKQLQETGTIQNQEIQMPTKLGELRTGLISVESIEIDGQTYLLWIGNDITERKQAEAALQAALEAAEVANRAKSQFLSHMSHELRSPLNVILGFTQLMLRNGSLTTQQQDYLDIISDSGKHLLTSINDVLQMSTIEAGKTILNEATCDVYELLDWMYRTLNLKARSKGLTLMVERAIDLPQYIHTDECKLRQILMNLLGNAIKFTEAGRVTLRVGIGNREDQSASYLLFEVEDTGVGIAPAELDTLFEPFVQTQTGRNSQEGTGLGLTISQQFVRLMGGEMIVKSRLREGTVVQFQIPAVAADRVPASAPSSQVIELEAGQPQYRILVVEDKLENRQILVELLTSVGFEVREAKNGQDAITLWQSWLPHLIWMDIRMPVLDGLAATQQIKAENSSHTPVIIAVTGSAFEEDRIAALSAGCDDFVRKPIRAETIFEKMVEHLEVRYRYAEATECSIAADSFFISPHLTPSNLAQLPPEWVEQLRQAATNVNAKQILKLVEQLSPSQTDLAKALTYLVENFQFDEVVSWTQQWSPD